MTLIGRLSKLDGPDRECPMQRAETKRKAKLIAIEAYKAFHEAFHKAHKDYRIAILREKDASHVE